jgi:predicted phage terminase large subunit-like protein
LHEERESKEALERMQIEMGSYVFSAQYQQRPAPAGGGIIKWEWFLHYQEKPKPEGNTKIVQSWDTASKIGEHNDYSVCTTWMIIKDHYYLLHVSRARLEFPDLKKQIIRLAKTWNARIVLIEDAGAGMQLLQDLKRQGTGLNIVGIIPKGDKQTRMMEKTPVIEGGRVSIPEEAFWLANFHHELVTFPKGKHDDQVDSVSQFLKWADGRSHRPLNPEDFIFSGPSEAMQEMLAMNPHLGEEYPWSVDEY